MASSLQWQGGSVKVMIVGLDCAEPTLALDRWRSELPTLSGLMDRGLYGRLTSIVPPITVPAWSCMMASRTPRRSRRLRFSEPRGSLLRRALHRERIRDSRAAALGSAVARWQALHRRQRARHVPPRPLNGVQISCFLTPSVDVQYTYPPMLRKEVEEVVGEYLFDCPNFGRTTRTTCSGRSTR